MKKVMISLLCIISVLLSCAYAFQQKVADNNEMVNFNTQADAIQLHIQSLPMDKEVLITEFRKLSDKYHITIVRTDYLFENGEQIIQKAGIFSDRYFEHTSLALYAGRYPAKADEYIASFATGQAQQVGTIRDLFEDQKMIVTSLEDAFAKAERTVNGEYTIEFEDLQYKDIVKTEISTFTGIDEASLFDRGYGSSSSVGTAYLIAMILMVVVGAIFALTNIFYPITKLKEIGVMKLLGYTNHSIWTELNASVILVPVAFTAIIDGVQALLIPQATGAYFLNLCLYQCMIILAGILISLMMLIIIKQLKIAQILKKFFHFRLSLYSSYLLKFLIFVGLACALPYMVKEVKRYVDESRMKDVYEEQTAYITLADYDFVDDEINGYLGIGEDRLGMKFIAMMKELETTAAAEYVSMFDINPYTIENQEEGQAMEAFQEESYVFSIVNENYLKRIDYHFEKPLEAYFAQDLTILIPMKYKSEKIEQLVMSSIVPIYFSEVVDQVEKWQNLPVSIQFYQDNNKKIFSERLDRASIENGFISDPIFICQSIDYLNTKNSLILNSAITNPLRIYDSTENRDAIQKAIVNNHLENNHLIFANMLQSGFAQQIAISQSSTFVWFGIITLALFVSVLSSYYISMIILISKKQWMLVCRLLGHSFFERYKNEICYFIGIYIVCLLEVVVLSRSLLAILCYIMLVFIDVGIVYWLVKRRDSLSLSTALKGEE